MKGNTKTSLATAALILLGIFALLAGEKSLALLVPAAVLVWYGATPRSATHPQLTRSAKIEAAHASDRH